MAIIGGDPYLDMKLKEELLKDGYTVEGDQIVKLPAKSVQTVRVKVKKANREELLSLRKKAIKEGMKLLSVDEILEEVKKRRSGEE